MPRKAKTPVNEPAPQDDEVLFETGQADEGGEDDALAELRGLGADGEYKFTVSRVARKPGEQGGYCATYSVGDLSLDAIREQFGGGKYRIKVTDSSGKYVTNRTVEIMDLPKPAAGAAPVAAPAPAAPAFDMQGLAALLSSVKPGGTGLDTIGPMLIAMMDNQAKMFQAIANRPPPETMKPMELVALLKATQQDSKSDPVELLMRGLELGKSLAGGSDDSLLGVAKTGLEALAPLIQQQAQQPRAISPAPAPVPAIPQFPQRPDRGPIVDPAVVAPFDPPNAAQPAKEGTDMDLIRKLSWLKAQTGALVVQASRGKDPGLYAEVFLDNLPPFITQEEVLGRFQNPDAVRELAQVDARVAQFADWFEAFRQEVVGLLTGQDEDEAPEPGDVPGLGDEA